MQLKDANISPRAFWDVDFDQLSPEKHKDFIIRRIFERGKWNDLLQLFFLYSEEEMIASLLSQQKLSRPAIIMANLLLDIPKNKLHASPKHYPSVPKKHNDGTNGNSGTK